MNIITDQFGIVETIIIKIDGKVILANGSEIFTEDNAKNVSKKLKSAINIVKLEENATVQELAFVIHQDKRFYKFIKNNRDKVADELLKIPTRQECIAEVFRGVSIKKHTKSLDWRVRQAVFQRGYSQDSLINDPHPLVAISA
ncbi:hypothetical protein [Commensalibacter communis]|uniref:Uncharacterized protein n=1 Tax=Commensalibacter communis TaxID=2972786 RepID=A0A9W4X7Q7_9PROT|nr:hypothetical protein [Commensalibacter communis]CAI3933898.1 unnamed protein product [Commensalibacter communis]CAI3942220.1 unnamed protein product [Commensalibacter communis]CAI3944312.1 unnamed protein product [Commensalibacter communis]CAI3944439.1 unnamed protein product [Commensalibacter communis]CAI3960413.1 unnamed protein product [Commensalibacter communis]